MASKNIKVTRLVVKAALRVVRLEKLQTDPSYQRELKQKHKRIVAEFNEDALGIPLIGEREDGSLWIVDGYQRISALRKLNWVEARVEVFASRGPEHEAEVFKLVNLNRTKLTAREEFKALLTAHDAGAWEIKETVERAGFRIAETKGKVGTAEVERNITCVNTLVAMRRECGIASLAFALDMAKTCWPGDRFAINNKMIEGLCYWFKQHTGVYDKDRLVPRLQSVTPHKLLLAANQAALSGGKAHSYAVADQIEKVHKKRYAR